MDINTLFRCGFLGLVLSLSNSVFAEDQSSNEAFKAAYGNYQKHINANEDLQALPYAQAAYELGLNIYGKTNTNSASLAYNYSLNLLKVGRDKAALKILKKTITHYEVSYGKDSFELIPVLMDAGKASYAHPSQAKPYYFKRAIKLANKHYGNESVEYATRNIDAGAILFAKARWKSAKRHFDTGYKILQHTLGETDPLTGLAAFNLGKYELSRQNNKAGIKYLNRALAAFDQGNGSNRKLTLATRGFLVIAHEMLGQRDAATEHSLAIGAATPFTGTEKYQPLVKISPRYPALTLEDRKEGTVTVEYDVDKTGFVINPQIVELEGSSAFKKPSLEAVKKFRYAPAFKDGKPILTSGVRTQFTFSLASIEKNRDTVIIR